MGPRLCRLFFRAAGRYLGLWLEAFCAPGRRISPLSARRLAFLLLGFPLLLLFLAGQAAGHLLDEVFFRRYRRVAVPGPVFIVGVPRSGTTFLHRTLAADTDTFLAPRLWEVVLAPSLTARKLLGLLARVDRLAGRPLRRLADWLVARAQGDFGTIHDVGLDAVEEDYLWLLPAAGCFLLVLAFPTSDPLWALANPGRDLAPREREDLLAFYAACVRKQVHARGRGRTFLSKNAAFGNWIPELRATFPGARFLYCVRDPAGALSSQLSSVEPGRRAFGADPRSECLPGRFLDFYRSLYTSAPANLGAGHDVRVVLQEALREHPEETIRHSLGGLGVPVSDQLGEVLRAVGRESSGHRSGHRHSLENYGLTAEGIKGQLAHAYEEIRSRASGAPGANG